MANKHNNTGFTLIELLVALGLISLVLVVGTNLYLVVQRNWLRTTSSNLITGNYDVVLSRISREIRTAQSPNYSTDAVHVIDGQHMDIYNYDEVNGIYTRTNYRYNNGNLERGSVTTTNKFASANPQFATIGNYRTVLSGLTNTSTQPVFTDNTIVANSDRKVIQVDIITANMETNSTYTSRYQAESLTPSAIAALEVQVTAVTISPETINPLAVNGTAVLSVTVTPSNATNNNVAWTSSAPAIATVDNNGNITGRAVGTAIITATAVDGGLSDTCTVTVTIPVTGVSLSASSLNIPRTTSAALTVTINPTNASDQTFTYTCSTTYVTVSVSGNTFTITAKNTAKNSAATLTVKTNNGNYTASCTINVVTVPVTGVSLNASSLNIPRTTSAALTVTINPTNASDQTFTYTCSTTYVTVSVSGNTFTITAKNTAKTSAATLTVKTNDGGYTASCTINVTT